MQLTMVTSGKSYFYHGTEVPKEMIESVDLIDAILLDASEITVKDLRAAIASVRQKPYGKFRLLTVLQANEMSDLLQNTLLKLLEEPPSYLIVILVDQTNNRLLPTVRSRLHNLTSIKTMSGSAKIAIESILESKTKDESMRLLQEMKQNYLDSRLEDEAKVRVISVIDQAIMYHQANVNHKLTLEWLRLHWPSVSGTSKQ